MCVYTLYMKKLSKVNIDLTHAKKLINILGKNIFYILKQNTHNFKTHDIYYK